MSRMKRNPASGRDPDHGSLVKGLRNGIKYSRVAAAYLKRPAAESMTLHERPSGDWTMKSASLTSGIGITAAVLAAAGALVIFAAPRVDSQSRPVKVLVAYHSESGNTRALAEAVRRGAQGVAGVEAVLKTVAEALEADVLAADALIVGSPVYNANVAPPVQEFINRWPFRGAPLKDKIGAAFASGGGISAGEELVQLSILHSMLVFNMIVVGGPGWRQAFGASAVMAEDPDFEAGKDKPEEAQGVKPYFLRKGEALGKRVAELALRLKAVQ
jgi:NAD(P)H dehydrogenase (quinone)